MMIKNSASLLRPSAFSAYNHKHLSLIISNSVWQRLNVLKEYTEEWNLIILAIFIPIITSKSIDCIF